MCNGQVCRQDRPRTFPPLSTTQDGGGDWLVSYLALALVAVILAGVAALLIGA